MSSDDRYLTCNAEKGAGEQRVAHLRHRAEEIHVLYAN